MTDLLERPYFDAAHNPISPTERVHAVYDPAHRPMNRCLAMHVEDEFDRPTPIKHYLVDLDLPEGAPIRTYHTRLCDRCLKRWTNTTNALGMSKQSNAERFNLRLDPEMS